MTAIERLTLAYTALVKAGRLTIEQVPADIRSAVEQALEA